jgi:pSer/pThr/pTyr-binding forkhead associated (FHA) protein
MATLERHGPLGFDLLYIAETGAPMSIGKSAANDIVIDGDEAVSRLHARLERLGAAWCITDLGAKNGTIVNGEMITSRKLYDRDEIILGRTRLVLLDASARRAGGTTQPVVPAPKVTGKEKEVLIELCRPILAETAFKQPARVEAIANALVVGMPAIRMHLGNLYLKFGILEGVDKRLQLANVAMQSGAVTRKDLERRPTGDT